MNFRPVPAVWGRQHRRFSGFALGRESLGPRPGSSVGGEVGSRCKILSELWALPGPKNSESAEP